MNATHLSIIPLISEKAYGQSQHNTYVFKVPTSANKQQVAAAVVEQYSVGVQAVRVVIAKGKVKRTVRKGRPYEGRRADTKKAYVTLAAGDSLTIFDDAEAAANQTGTTQTAAGSAQEKK